MTVVSFPQRLRSLAEADPDRPAATDTAGTWTREALERWTNRLARELLRHGVRPGDMVTIALPNGVEWIATMIATWKAGATPQPVSSRLPARELRAILALARPQVVVGDVDVDGPARLPSGFRPDEAIDAGPLPDVVAPAWKAPTSGGSTGRPKLIVSGDPTEMETDEKPPLRLIKNGCLVMPGPLYHNAPLVWTARALLWGSHVVVLPRFDAEATLAAVAEHRADTLYLVPTMMRRISRLPDEHRLRYDLSSLRTVWHVAEPCPDWLKQQWIDWLGPDRIWELYGGTEAQAITIVSGRQWLEHRGSVGRAVEGEVLICGPDGAPVPPGTVGEVWLRPTHDRPAYRYLGAEARVRAGGWESLGDLGRLDEDGYLYLVDREQDMILSGGANVYPAEIEGALCEHPAVRSCAVIGLPDDDRGQRVHAIVEADPLELDAEALRAFLAGRLVDYKIPRTWELVHEPLRDEAGKVRRGELRQARLGAGS